MQAVLTKAESITFLDEVFPQIRGEFELMTVRNGGVSMQLQPQERHLRPGNTVSGPTMFALVDVTAYVAVLTHIGREALAVTTHCSIDFMRKPSSGQNLVAEGTILKLGRRLAVVDVKLYSEGTSGAVAAASVTYAIPEKSKA